VPSALLRVLEHTVACSCYMCPAGSLVAGCHAFGCTDARPAQPPLPPEVRAGGAGRWARPIATRTSRLHLLPDFPPSSITAVLSAASAARITLCLSWRLCDVAARPPRPPRSKTIALLLFLPKSFGKKCGLGDNESYCLSDICRK
jgi:hypothetical protein